MNVDLSSGHDDMKQRYEFACKCGTKFCVTMEPGTPGTLTCKACGAVVYQKEGPRVFAGPGEMPSSLAEDTAPSLEVNKTVHVDPPRANGRRKDKKPAVTVPPASEKVELSDEENDRARRMLDWLS